MIYPSFSYFLYLCIIKQTKLWQRLNTVTPNLAWLTTIAFFSKMRRKKLPKFWNQKDAPTSKFRQAFTTLAGSTLPPMGKCGTLIPPIAVSLAALISTKTIEFIIAP